MNSKWAKSLRRLARTIANEDAPAKARELVPVRRPHTRWTFLVNEPSSERGIYRELKRNHPNPTNEVRHG